MDQYGYNDAEPSFSFPRALTVTEVNEFIKQLFETIPQLRRLSVQGEISNFKNHYATGHLYFTLKDDTSSIKAVMFRERASRLKFVPENGMKVTVSGRISVYPRDGQYQIYCDTVEPLGIGSLWAAYEQLKKKLSAEGLFDASHKKPIPKFPASVGVITSATGAAVRDVINVTSRRWPIAKLTVYPSLVQGDGAVDDLISGLKRFNEKCDVDVIIIGRGGGSIEDLWAFNSEKLARAVFASKIPVISAVGHETDFTICDFVADVRAPTPSAAAEIAVPDAKELRQYIDALYSRLVSAESSKIDSLRVCLNRFSSSRALTDPMAFIDDKKLLIGKLYDRLCREIDVTLDGKKSKIASLSGLLNSLSPLSVLSRGYGAVRGEDGKIVKSVKTVSVGEHINVKLGDGELLADVTGITE